MSQGRAARFSALVERDGLFVMPNPWDISMTRILKELGFEALAEVWDGW